MKIENKRDISYMASLSPLPIILILCTIVLMLWCRCEADLIANVCSKSINPSLCTQALESDPRSRGADLRGLGQIIVEKSAAATNDTMGAVKSVSGANDTGAVDVCMETCTDALDDLSDCSQLLKAGGSASKADLQTKASAAITNVQTCDDEFQEEEGGAEPPQVKEASNRAKDLIDVFLVIANSL